MPEKKISEMCHKEQKEIKPTPEIIISECLDGEAKKMVSDFVVWLRENKMSPRYLTTNSWVVKYKNKSLCHFNVRYSEKSWEMRFSHFTRENWFTGYEKYITDDRLKKFVLDHISGKRCPDNMTCGGNYSRTILGKNYDEVCWCWPLSVRNPGGETLEYAKTFILVIRKIIADLDAANKK